MRDCPIVKVTATEPGPDGVVIRVEGRLGGEAAGELRRTCDATGREPSAVTLDLTGLVQVDESGRRALAELRRRGCRIVGASMYIAYLLEEKLP